MAIAAGIIGIVGQKTELLKWRVIGSVLLAASVVIGVIFGPSVYTDPITNLLTR